MIRDYPKQIHQRIGFGKIFFTALLAGTLDIACALIQFHLVTGKDPRLVFNYISSSVYGSKAYGGGDNMIVLGVVLHYVVALLFSLFFYLIFKPLRLYKIPRLLTGILYGAFIWCVMNLGVVPMSLAKQGPFNLKGVSQAMGILMIAIGIPLSYIVSQQYSKHEIR